MMKLNYKKMLINLVILLALYFVLHLSIRNDGLFSYKEGLYINILIYMLFSVSLCISVGIMGQLNLGHAGFIAVGAYTSAVITRAMPNLGINNNIKFIIAIIISAILSGIVGLLISYITLRFKGDYLAIITLAFGEIIKYIIQNIEFLGGAMGFKSIPLYTNFTNAYIIVVLSLAVFFMLAFSKFGRLMTSVRENEIAAENIGVNTNKIKMYGFFLSAFFAGIGGALFAHNLGMISPDKFSFVFSVEILVMVVFGGLGSITGSILSAGVITVINELLRQAIEYRGLIYAMILIIVMLYRPQGLLGTKEYGLDYFLNKIKGIKNEIITNRKNGN